MSQAVLVTGAEGFIGRHLIPLLRASGWLVVPHTRASGDIARSDFQYNGIGHVVHLAARSFVPDSWVDSRPFYETNVVGTVNVLEFCRRGGAALTLLSSYVYGRPQSLPVTEDHPVAACNPYAHSKILAEEVARYYAAQFGVPVTIIRPFNIYGPGQIEGYLIPTLVRQALSPGCEEIVVQDDRPRRDYLYVGDLVELLLKVVELPLPGIFNAGSGRSVSIPALLAEINALLGTNKRLVSRRLPRAGEVLELYADARKAERAFQWIPKTPLREGLRQVIAAARLDTAPA
jgi:nucleoside-diphosphate-sugar epimerase